MLERFDGKITKSSDQAIDWHIRQTNYGGVVLDQFATNAANVTGNVFETTICLLRKMPIFRLERLLFGGFSHYGQRSGEHGRIQQQLFSR